MKETKKDFERALRDANTAYEALVKLGSSLYETKTVDMRRDVLGMCNNINLMRGTLEVILNDPNTFYND